MRPQENVTARGLLGAERRDRGRHYWGRCSLVITDNNDLATTPCAAHPLRPQWCLLLFCTIWPASVCAGVCPWPR